MMKRKTFVNKLGLGLGLLPFFNINLNSRNENISLGDDSNSHITYIRRYITPVIIDRRAKNYKGLPGTILSFDVNYYNENNLHSEYWKCRKIRKGFKYDKIYVYENFIIHHHNFWEISVSYNNNINIEEVLSRQSYLNHEDSNEWIIAHHEIDDALQLVFNESYRHILNSDRHYIQKLNERII